MIRKIFLFAALLLTLTYTNAQSVGEWNIFTQFKGTIDDLADTKEKVYFTSGNRLFSYDKEANETYSYTTKNKLNDTNVTIMRYNPDGKYLFVGYDNGNIDLLYDNGRVVNLSDIKDATLTYKKGINSVTFASNRMYLGTEFGIVIYDDQKHEVVESGIYGFPIQTVFPVRDVLFVHRADPINMLYHAPLSGHHNTFSKFTEYRDFYTDWFYPVGDKYIVYKNKGAQNQLWRYTIDLFGEETESLWKDCETGSLTGNLQLSPSGMYVTTDNSIVMLNEEGIAATTINLPEPLHGQRFATYSAGKSIWAANADGVGEYSVEDGKLTVLSEKAKPEGIVTDEVFFLRTDDHGGIWAGNLGVAHNLPVSKGKGDWAEIAQGTTRIKDGKIEDMNVFDAKVYVDWSVKRQEASGTKRLFGGCSGFAVDPEYPNRYYQGNNMEGIYVIEDNKELIAFSHTNKNLPDIQYTGWDRVQDVRFDKEGNLWFGAWSASASKSPVWVLPKSVLRGKDLKDIQPSDWLPSKHLGMDAGEKDFRLYPCKKSDVMFSWHGPYENPLGVLMTKGTWGNPNDDVYFEMEDLMDQDGKIWRPTFITCAVEDHDGKVWIGGSSGGVIEIANPNELTEKSRVTRIKVPRNDGTNYADYLCETDIVYDMAVDNSNRKWIVTESSGVYLVSPNGDAILEHFTTDNSPLPSNQVLSVVCDPNSNKVYFGLSSGLVSYNSDSSPAAEDYSEVYAYPNPVKPDYTGYITITGLMDNSLVKITDASGRVVFQTTSEGGMAVWDGFDANHNRVKTGVYYVFASSGANSDPKGAVTKIMVIR